MLHKLNNFVKEITEQIKYVYLYDMRPWVIGYSGGKDSTAVIQIIFNALCEIDPEKRNKPVYIISSDTMVETPLIISYIENTLRSIQEKASELSLPISCHKVSPEINKTFWVSLIGKGYPPPRQKFRWCTDKLKIAPANKFILDKVSKFGEVIMVLGVRKGESQARDQVLRSHEIEGKILQRHTTLTNAFVYAPIQNFSTDDVWDYLLTTPSPWGGNNNKLLELYQNSSGECPLVTDQLDKSVNTPSCGNSRFGCWICTVVKEDKALIGFIENGEEWLEYLLIFRNWLIEIRENEQYRDNKRKDGSVYYLGEGEDKRKGLGPFNLHGRKAILKELLLCQKTLNEDNRTPHRLELITREELKEVRKVWLQEGDWEDSLPDIYKEVYGIELNWEVNERPLFSENELEILGNLCSEEGVSVEIIKKLITVESEYYGYKYRNGILKNINSILNQGWIHSEKIEVL
ncbi:DNA sulfur modification protein DndC [Anaerobacterium chartisolvens]|uniref:DNA sulfur modification protein DndC n=1 Tax=Anaerobacterium chartisolvens TaxID=1297424 RepID=A0A369AS86_9FIRM|nr:DNA phosphorothioation system sulfurtransferase DndC [Anaerobacterium chartisolvens]RCX12101.1 DNA sulfur modification protein DndC [Anaerobacterium chartisolvens]